MKNYLVVSLMFEAKYKAIGAFDPASNILMVLDLERIDKNGMFDREKLLKEIRIAREGGYQTLVETRDKSFLKHTPIIALSERNEDSRVHQDVYFEHLETMYQARLLDVGEVRRESFKAFQNRVKKSVDPRSGRIAYEFKDLEKNELRPVMLLVALHIDPPRGVGFALGIEQAMGSKPKGKSRIERMKYAVGIGFDEQNDAYWEKKLKQTQANFK